MKKTRREFLSEVGGAVLGASLASCAAMPERGVRPTTGITTLEGVASPNAPERTEPMFFLVTHTWKIEDEEQVSKAIIQLMIDCHYGKIGDPWPKLFNLWQDPREPRITALWESSSRPALEKVFENYSAFQTELRHVRQLYPPHVGGYNIMQIKTDPDWPWG